VHFKFKQYKPASIFVVYLDEHCRAQELSASLSGSCKMEEIFHGGSTCPLKIRASFYFCWVGNLFSDNNWFIIDAPGL